VGFLLGARGGGGGGSGLTPTAVKTGAYTAAAGEFVPVDTTGGAVTVTLPSAPADGARVGVKMVVQGGTNAVTVARGGTDVFNKAGGSTSLTLALVFQSVMLQYQASSGIWYVQSTDAASGTTYRTVNSIAVMGGINVPSGDTDVIPGFFFTLPTGRTATLYKVRYQIGNGTSVTAKLQINGADAAAYSAGNALSITTTAAETSPGSKPSLANNDYVQLVVTAVSGTPVNLTVSIVCEIT
jgi:hypothetical protein